MSDSITAVIVYNYEIINYKPNEFCTIYMDFYHKYIQLISDKKHPLYKKTAKDLEDIVTDDLRIDICEVPEDTSAFIRITYKDYEYSIRLLLAYSSEITIDNNTAKVYYTGGRALM